MIYVVHKLYELSSENNLTLYMFFIDLQKACDLVDRSLLWKVPPQCSVPAKIVAIICQFHDGMRACVRLESIETSAPFDVDQDFRRGCVITPICSTSS